MDSISDGVTGGHTLLHGTVARHETFQTRANTTLQARSTVWLQFLSVAFDGD